MKIICLLTVCLFGIVTATQLGKTLRNTYEFGCYAPLGIYGGWCSSGHGIDGQDTVTISVTPVGKTTLFCEINCCGNVAEFLDQVTCDWNCIGTPAIRCKGNPLGSAVQAIQQS